MIPITPGTRLGHFQILGRVGSGGMGEVYRALDTRLRREVAIKVLPPHLDGDSEALHRFEKEALALAQLSHPNILSIFDVGSDQGVTFAVMELLEGTTLRERIAEGGLPWSEAVEVALGVAEGLAAAHRKGIVHRDLKPSNIFLTADGRVKILDFGLVRLSAASLSDDSSTASLRTGPKTSSGQLVGTVGYIAPEQLLEQPVDERSDLFSFGCILWEMLSGRRAFARKTVPSTLLALVTDDPPAIGEMTPGLPESLVELVAACLEKDPGRRLGSAEEAAAVLRGLEHSSRTVPLDSPFRRRARRRILRWSAVGGLLGVAAIALLAWQGALFGAGDEPPPRSIAVLPLQSLDDDGQGDEGDYFSDGLTEDLIARLSRIGDLRVISRGTTQHYRDLQDEMSLPEIAAQLDVATVLQGSVRRSGRRVRVVSALVDGGDGETLWAESYDREIDDIFAVQTDVAEQIAAALETTLAPAEEQRVRRAPTDSPEAYQLYLRGRYFWNRRSVENFRRAIDYFERALELDPRFALAYAGLADAYTLLPYYGGGDRESYELARAAAERALELDPSLAEPYVTVAFIEQYHDWDFIAAENDFRRALLLNPSYATGHHWYALLLAQMTRYPEAEREVREALALDPFSSAIQKNAATIVAAAGDVAEGKALMARALEGMPDLPDAHHQLAVIHLRAGEPREAMAAIRRELAISGADRGVNAGLEAVIAVQLGDVARARAIVADLEARYHARPAAAEAGGGERPPVLPYAIAQVHAVLGDETTAMRWYETAYQQRDSFLLSLASDLHLVDVTRFPGGEDLARRVYGDAWTVIRGAGLRR